MAYRSSSLAVSTHEAHESANLPTLHASVSNRGTGITSNGIPERRLCLPTAPRTCCLPAGILVDRHELVSYCVSSASFTPRTAAQPPDRPHPANLTMLYRNGTSMDSPSQSTFGAQSGIDRSQSTTIFAGGCSLCYLGPCIRRDLEAKSNALQRLLQNVPLS